MRFKLSKRRVMNASLQNFSSQPTGVSRVFLFPCLSIRARRNFKPIFFFRLFCSDIHGKLGSGSCFYSLPPPPPFKIPQPWFVAAVVHIKVQDLSPNYFPYTQFSLGSKRVERGGSDSPILCRNSAFPGQTRQQRFSLPT